LFGRLTEKLTENPIAKLRLNIRLFATFYILLASKGMATIVPQSCGLSSLPFSASLIDSLDCSSSASRSDETRYHYQYGMQSGKKLWQASHPNHTFFETHLDTPDFKAMKKKTVVIRRTFEQDFKLRDKPVDQKWILKEGCSLTDGALSFAEEQFSSKQALLQRLNVDGNLEEIFTIRVDRFFGRCTVPSCKEENCCWVDISISHHEDLSTSCLSYAILTSKHSLTTKRKPAASKLLIFFDHLGKRPAFFDTKDFTEEKKLVEGSRSFTWTVNDFE
jgi:hypothetical protein